VMALSVPNKLGLALDDLIEGGQGRGRERPWRDRWPEPERSWERSGHLEAWDRDRRWEPRRGGFDDAGRLLEFPRPERRDFRDRGWEPRVGGWDARRDFGFERDGRDFRELRDAPLFRDDRRPVPKPSLMHRALKNTTCQYNEDGNLGVVLYVTEVVTFLVGEKAGTAVLTSGGYRTFETLHILNEALQPFGYDVQETEDRTWYVTSRAGREQFWDGMTLTGGDPPIEAETCFRHLEPILAKYKRRGGRRSRSPRARLQARGAVEEVTEFQ